MNIAVLIKQVPDTDEVKLDPETGTMIREGLENIINPLDLHALEAALRIKETNGAKVTVVTMGPPVAEEALREAIAMGADTAVLVSDRRFAGADTYATARTLVATLWKLGNFDLILAGEKSIDGETGQVGPEVGALMGIPVLSYVSDICDVSESGIVAEREVEEGKEKWKVSFPCLLTVTKDVNEPRLPTLSGKKKAKKAKIEVLNCDMTGIDPAMVGLKGSPTRVVKISTPKISRTVEMYEGKNLNKGIDKVIELLKPFLEVEK
ncbi:MULTISPECIES: electron transfer flavoprotein subunit beta/FixA family protein [Kosmotoga]|uniref:Electron transfer flavoprotein alpha/beta-subunit n=1 Tax=Kosmotoga olearia (strain ATCC BAA-1733 / DSM 21960 / TBF 19.5.1) TaxID=521045 RepID=C5CH75_KOSOT|nr:MULTISPECIES: electron transfer flavoprotein subunit beta/FixA family protein [Kosmotoga]ACR80678.1 Electron transfer flavoprotein alpha/beta-subunit [Kosmotoga olearia TBF 19.5.1]OAA19128.1 electron transfer flavoprotein subunit beta [Kosmotoga sp. DU53]